MEISITLPEQLVADAEDLAQRLGISVNELFAAALADFVARHRSEEVTRRHDEVYASEPSALAPGMRAAQRRTLHRTEW